MDSIYLQFGSLEWILYIVPLVNRHFFLIPNIEILITFPQP